MAGDAVEVESVAATGLREAVADVIALHDSYRVNDDGWTVCLCGHVTEGDDDDGSHARHVADILAAHPEPPEADPTAAERACPACGHTHPDGDCDCWCTHRSAFCGRCGWIDCECPPEADPTAAERACDCDFWHSKHRQHCATNYPAEPHAENGEALAARVLRVIQRTADVQGNVTMIRLAERIAADLTSDWLAADRAATAERARRGEPANLAEPDAGETCPVIHSTNPCTICEMPASIQSADDRAEQIARELERKARVARTSKGAVPDDFERADVTRGNFDQQAWAFEQAARVAREFR